MKAVKGQVGNTVEATGMENGEDTVDEEVEGIAVIVIVIEIGTGLARATEAVEGGCEEAMLDAGVDINEVNTVMVMLVDCVAGEAAEKDVNETITITTTYMGGVTYMVTALMRVEVA